MLAIGCAITAGALLVVAGYFVLRPRNPCSKALGPLSELEVVAGRALRADEPIGPYGKSRSCILYVQEKAQLGNPTLILEVEDPKLLEPRRKQHEGERFTSQARIDLGDEAWLFVAGDLPEPSTDELARRAQQNVRPRHARGLGYDPIGAALASLPPAHHVILARRGSTLLELKFERRTFTPETAKVAAAKIVARVK